MSTDAGPTHGPPFAGYQAEIFLRGMAGETPEHPISLAEVERIVEETAEPRAAAYVLGGAGAEQTMAANLLAFRRWRLVPRMLRDVSERDLSVTVAGTKMPAPLALAPIGVQSIVHPDGELAVARAAAALGLTMTVSTVSSFPLEQIAGAGAGPKWFQLYWPRDPELMESFVGRAEEAGYEAIVLTVDTFLPGWKPRDLAGRLAAVPRGRRDRQLPLRPGVPGTPREAAGAGPAGGGRRVRRAVLEPVASLGRPRPPALRDRAADSGQGRAARGRRPRGA